MSYVVSKSFGAWYDAIQSLVPQNTVVGRLLQGDYSGAASGAIRFTAQAGRAPTTMVQPVKPPTTAGLFSPGGFIEKNQTVLLLAAAGLAAFLVLGKKRR